jgi:hypothetical protein
MLSHYIEELLRLIFEKFGESQCPSMFRLSSHYVRELLRICCLTEQARTWKKLFKKKI